MKYDSSLPPLSTAARAEAAAWVARLHSADRTRALEAGFRQWLKADPAHARAFELATEAWEIGGCVAGGALPRVADSFQSARPARTIPGSYLALAAAIGVLAVGLLLHLHHERAAVTTTVGEQRMLTLEDGSRIFLNTNTRLFVREEIGRREVRLQSGEALFDVAKDPRRPFIVTAGEQSVVALGTSFVVRRDASSVSVTLMEGKVAVSPRPPAQLDGALEPGQKLDDVTTLTPGQRLTFIERERPRLDEPSIEKVTAWRRGEVILDKTRLQDAVDEMNRYSAVKLVIEDPDAANIRISGIFRAGDSARFALAVGETYHLSVDHELRRIVISRPPS